MLTSDNSLRVFSELDMSHPAVFAPARLLLVLALAAVVLGDGYGGGHGGGHGGGYGGGGHGSGTACIVKEIRMELLFIYFYFVKKSVQILFRFWTVGQVKKKDKLSDYRISDLGISYRMRDKPSLDEI
jgi:hypothetical protein